LDQNEGFKWSQHEVQLGVGWKGWAEFGLVRQWWQYDAFGENFT